MKFRFPFLFLLVSLFLGPLSLRGWAQPAATPAASAGAPPAPAGQSKELHIGLRQIAPFVMKDDKTGEWTGFSVELWEAISKEMGTQSKYTLYPNVNALIAGVKSGKEASGVGATSITSKRDHVVDFSQPFYDSGLQIMTRGKAEAPSLLDGLIALLQSPVMTQFLIAVALLIIIPSHILWALERHYDEGIIRHRAYFPGIFEAVWWTVSCLATQAEEMPKTVFARVLAVIWMFFAIIFIAYVTAALTANLTLQSLHGNIQGPKDLPGKRVATVAGSTSEEYLKTHNAIVVSFPDDEKAIAALNAQKVEAVVYDAPILRYYANGEDAAPVQLVGPVFRPENYGFILPNNSPWRKQINYALLTLRENGVYDDIKTKYFGTDD